eukprot:753551-Hanusia_phi.AAC.2
MSGRSRSTDRLTCPSGRRSTSTRGTGHACCLDPGLFQIRQEKGRDDTEILHRMHSFNARRDLLISAPSMRVCLSLSLTSEARSLPAKSMKLSFPTLLFILLNCICYCMGAGGIEIRAGGSRRSSFVANIQRLHQVIDILDFGLLQTDNIDNLGAS